MESTACLQNEAGALLGPSRETSVQECPLSFLGETFLGAWVPEVRQVSELRTTVRFAFSWPWW